MAKMVGHSIHQYCSSSSPLSDSTGSSTPNVVYPTRQPLGPSLDNNFASRTPPVTRKMSQLNLDAPSFEPAGLI